MKIVITGGTGFIGSVLVDHLIHTYDAQITLLTRQPKAAPANASISSMYWDAESVGDWAQSLNDADAVIHLAGEPIVGKPWTKAQKQRLWDSRIKSTRAIVDAIKQVDTAPKTLISASAVGIYDVHDTHMQDEASSPASSFVGQLCVEWEAEAERASEFGVRVVTPRFGMVLGRNGGLLMKLVLPLTLAVAGPLGKGKDPFMWVHLDDIIGFISHSLTATDVSGAYNLVAPDLTTQKEFLRTLGKVIKRPLLPAVPAFLVKKIMGSELADILLYSAPIVPKRTLETYTFIHTDLFTALDSIYR